MTFQDRVAALEYLGFTERQTQFVVLAALHGGFCLPRQYMQFANARPGLAVHRFFQRLVDDRLARPIQFRPDRGPVYHLWPSHLYDAIGEPDNRNRRLANVAHVARKVMLFDFVLADSPTSWLATEHDKVQLFRDVLHISEVDLPHRLYRSAEPTRPSVRRCFVHKLPVRIAADEDIAADDETAPEGSRRSRRVVFSFLAVDDTGRAFGHFLHDHLPLFSALSHWTIAAVGTRRTRALSACQQAWTQFAAKLSAGPARPENPDLPFLLGLQRRLRAGEAQAVTQADYDRWKQLRRRFDAVDIEGLIDRWQHASPPQKEEAAAVRAAIAEGRGTLVTHQLPWRYDGFGSRPGVT